MGRLHGGFGTLGSSPAMPDIANYIQKAQSTVHTLDFFNSTEYFLCFGAESRV